MIATIAARLSRGLVFVLTAFLRAYQLTISPSLGPACRFDPSCSEYTRQAVQRYGVVLGLWRGALRLMRCHPYHPGGWDPIR